MSPSLIAKSFLNQYKTFQWWIDGFGPAGGSLPHEWKSHAKKRLKGLKDKNEEKCGKVPEKAKWVQMLAVFLPQLKDWYVLDSWASA